jgi:hypothetical protein
VRLGPVKAAPFDRAGLLAGAEQGSWQGNPRRRKSSQAALSGVDPLQRAWHNHLAPARVSMRPTSLVQTSEHLLATGCRQCRRSPAVKEAFLQRFAETSQNRTWHVTMAFDDDS